MTAAAQAIAPVAIHGWSPSTYILLFIAILNTGAAGAWIRARGGWKKDEVNADERLREEMWKDIAALKAGKDDTSRRLTIAETKIASQTVEIGQLRFVSRLMVIEIERLDPNNAIAKQARVILETVQPMAMPSDVEIGTMAEVVAKMSKKQ